MTYIIVTYISGLIIFSLFMVISTIVGQVTDWHFSRKDTIDFPTAVLADNIMKILSPKEVWNEYNLIEFECKGPLLMQLEHAANVIEHYLPQKIQTGDTVTDDWFRTRARKAAAAIRNKKKWILTPKEDTYDNFIASMASTLLCTLNGNWDSLEYLEPEKLTRPQVRSLIRGYIIKGLRTILVASLPIVTLIALQRTFPNFFQGAVLTSILPIVIFYEISVLGSMLDPDFNKRASDAQDFMSKLIPGQMNSKKDN